jgi:rsbT antagonist protein RsbS
MSVPILKQGDVLIASIQAALAFSMVQLGLSLEGVATPLDLKEGLALLSTRQGARAVAN